MGNQFSKKSGGGGSVSIAVADNIHSTPERSSYEAACRLDPEIQIFDFSLQQRTSRVISNLAISSQLRSLSFDTLKEVTGCLLETNQDVVRIILDCKKDIWKNSDLFDLVEEFFNNSLHTLDFCTVLEKCLKNSRDSQIIVQLALQSFEEEDAAATENGKTKYEKTLEELQRFRASSNPFPDEFFQAFQSVFSQQLLMFEKLHHRKKKLDKKLKSIRAWRRVSCIIFASVCVALLICSVVAAIVAAPPVATAIAAASSIPMGSIGKWFDSMWKDHQDALMAEKDLIGTMQARTVIAISDLDSIRVMVNRLEDQIRSMIENAEFAFREEEAVRFGVEEIRNKMGLFLKSIEDLVMQADRCCRDISRARTVVLQRIAEHHH